MWYPSVDIMEDTDFKGMFSRAKEALESLDITIANLDEELAKARRQRVAAAVVYNAVAPLVGEQLLPADSDILLPVLDPQRVKTSGITVAIRYVLDASIKENFTPAQMRDRLAEIGWDWSKYTNPLATVHTTLTRLAEAGKAKTERNSDNRRSFYSANRPVTRPVRRLSQASTFDSPLKNVLASLMVTPVKPK